MRAIFCDPIKVREKVSKRGDEGASKRRSLRRGISLRPSLLLRNFPELPTSYQSESEWAVQGTVQRGRSPKNGLWRYHLLSYSSLVQLLIIVLKVSAPPSEPIY